MGLFHNQEFLNLMQNHIINSDSINADNLEAFKKCCQLAWNIEVGDTCESCKRNYLVSLKDYWKRQLAKGWNPNIDKSIPDDLIDE